MIFFALPETLKATKDFAAEGATDGTGAPRRPQLSRTSTREAVQQRSKQYARLLRMMFLDPLRVLGNLRFPLVLLCVYYSSVTFGSLYVLNISIQYTFEKPPYDFTTLIVGLLCEAMFLVQVDPTNLYCRYTQLTWIHSRSAAWRSLDGQDHGT